MKLMVLLILITVDTFAQLIPISQARKLKSGTVVTIAGRITASKEFGDLSFLQDNTGAIPIYSATMAMAVAPGDSVSVSGALSKFNGLLEVLPESWRRIDAAPESIIPKNIEPRQAKDHEAELVTIAGVLMMPPGHFFYPQREGLLVKGIDSLHYWIDGDTDLPGYSTPSSIVSITGVVGRYRDQFQVIPRSAGDIPGLTYPSIISNDQTFTVINWNLEFFGATREKYGSEYGPADETLQMSNAALLLNYVQPDIVALQEISDDVAFRALTAKLTGYEGRCSSRYSYSQDASDNFPPQKVCYVYKTSAVRVVREKILFRKSYDDATIPPSAFSSGRLPYLLETDVTSNGITERIYFVNIHGKSGAAADDYARRVFDAQLLKDTLDQYYGGRKLIVLGDFNDDLDISIAGRRASPYSIFVNDNDYNCISKTLSDDNWHSTISYDDVIDHQIVSGLTAISTRIVNAFVLIKNYASTTSDHLPVMSEFDLRSSITGIDDFEQLQIPIDLENYRLFDTLGRELGAFENQPPGLYIVVTPDKIIRVVKP